MRIIKTKSYEEMSKKAANIIASVVTLKPDCMLGLATGSSPIGTYEELVKKYEGISGVPVDVKIKYQKWLRDGKEGGNVVDMLYF